ncbi:hypothetical protein H634G_10094 [Metarhizium anisopliae BRIP 53293]|uniref:Uncharacterized protein n=1 Tax=Metarhizium anisopliae BRIP 53293 TaxID=1291518 RepID=A0A0D9NPP2_METAN|nr:hypothetical protein H634G_10094 [Metarhizium anisopliae BRIP 53293]KJK94945.1 hypothetical protein H633G_01171 [Metarhizium anisopliae BRIP 53284]
MSLSAISTLYLGDESAGDCAGLLPRCAPAQRSLDRDTSCSVCTLYTGAMAIMAVHRVALAVSRPPQRVPILDTSLGLAALRIRKFHPSRRRGLTLSVQVMPAHFSRIQTAYSSEPGMMSALDANSHCEQKKLTNSPKGHNLSDEVYRNSEAVSFDDCVQGLMRNNGNDEEAIKAVFTALPVDKAGFPNPRGESIGPLASVMHAHQLHPGANLAVLQDKVQKWLNCHVHPKEICAKPTTTSSGRKSVEVPFYQWCLKYFIQLGQDIYFGEMLARIDPTLPSTFFSL